MAEEQEQGVIVFFSYARRDKMLRDRLEEHLSNLKYRGLIQTWHDRDILAGSDWLEQIDISLHNAQIILLLISSTFMASDYCYGKEMRQALQLHAQEKATVIPILLRPVLYAGAPFARLSMLPANGKPVTSWRDRDSAFVDVAINIEKVALYYVEGKSVKQPALTSQLQSLSGDSGGARGATLRSTVCPTCGAETRPGDNFCLNCGNRLVPSTPAQQQAGPAMGMVGDTTKATLPDQEWAPAPFTTPTAPSIPWNDSDLLTVASTSVEPATLRADSPISAAQAVMNKIENPGRLILRSENGEVLQEYVLDKTEMSIGRAPNSGVLLSKDKLTSRRHATIMYQNGQYLIQDERSANGTFVNSQQLDQLSPRVLNDSDQIGIGEHELLFRAAQTASPAPDIESMPAVMVSPSVAGEMTYRTRDDEMLTTATSDEFGTRSMHSGEIPQPGTPPENVGTKGYGGENISNATFSSDEHTHLISEAIRRAYYTESVDAYERTLSNAPENDEALRGLGRALYGLARYDEALDAFRRALLFKETPAAYAGLGDVLLKCKRYGEAVAAYETACELDQDVALDYPNFIQALREVGRADEADRMYVRGQDLGYFDDV
jgi:pSer/pThr/pTyr-binding forkhead associated (FHA) protein